MSTAMSTAVSTESRRFHPRWILLVLALGLLNVVIRVYRAGKCVDYSQDSSLASYCTDEPAIGTAAATVIAVASVIVAIYAIYRFARTQKAGHR